VIDLGRGWRKFKKGLKNATSGNNNKSNNNGVGKRNQVRRGWSAASSEGSEADPSRAWRGTSEEPVSPKFGTTRQMHNDDDEEDRDEDDDEEDEEEITSR
jgi:hypothetical protein